MDKPCIYIPINVSASEIDWGLLNLFKKRFNILRSNYKDLDLGLIQGAFSIDKGNRYSGSFNLPNEFRLKGLYVDYRHFYLNNEPTNFFKVANYINKLTTDQNFRNFISEEKKKFRSSFIEEDFSNSREHHSKQKRFSIFGSTQRYFIMMKSRQTNYLHGWKF